MLFAAESFYKVRTENRPLGLTARNLLLIKKNNINKMVGLKPDYMWLKND